VVDILLVPYLTGWLLVALVAYAAGRRYTDRRSPAPHPLRVSAVAGAVWPLLVVGVVEMSTLVVWSKVHAKPRPGAGIFA
jgi:hypothetical protein